MKGGEPSSQLALRDGVHRSLGNLRILGIGGSSTDIGVRSGQLLLVLEACSRDGKQDQDQTNVLHGRIAEKEQS